MYTLELEELQKQIKLLLESGQTVPSSSPYGAPILFAEKKGAGGGGCACVLTTTLSIVILCQTLGRYPGSTRYWLD